MFNKLSVLEKSKLYAAVAELETHYSPESVNEGLKLMADRLDQEKKITFDPNLKEVKKEEFTMFGKDGWVWHENKPAEDQMELLPFEPENPEAPEEKTKQKNNKHSRLTQQRAAAEKIAARSKKTLDEFLIYHYYVKGLSQYEIAEILDVNQKTVSTWLSKIPQIKVRRMVGGVHE